MPRLINGSLLICEKSIKKFVERLNEIYKDIIWNDLDETHCILNPKKVKFVMDEIEKLQTENQFEPFKILNKINFV